MDFPINSMVIVQLAMLILPEGMYKYTPKMDQHGKTITGLFNGYDLVPKGAGDYALMRV